MLPQRTKLKSWLNASLKIKLSDDRVIVGVFMCTDRDCNIILGGSLEYLNDGKTVLIICQLLTLSLPQR